MAYWFQVYSEDEYRWGEWINADDIFGEISVEYVTEYVNEYPWRRAKRLILQHAKSHPKLQAEDFPNIEEIEELDDFECFVEDLIKDGHLRYNDEKTAFEISKAGEEWLKEEESKLVPVEGDDIESRRAQQRNPESLMY